MLTIEQQKVIDTVITANQNIIAVNAVAGSGKTSTAEAVIKAVNPTKGFYTAFNKGIVEDAQKRFGKLLEVKTIHALAYKYIQPKLGIEELTYNRITENISYKDKKTIIELLDNFFRSEYINLNEYFEIHCENQYLIKIAERYANKMLQDVIPVTFNFMLKCLHILLYNKEIKITYDLAILDECLTAKTLIDTNKGIITIKKICKDINKNKIIFVKSFNITTNIFEYKQAIKPLISHNREVIELITEGLNKIKCTPNHKILTQYGYIEAKNLDINKHYLITSNPNNQKTRYILNNDQLQVVLGSYLGDGYLSKQNHNTYRLNFTNNMLQLKYLQWKTECLNVKNNIHNIKNRHTGKYNIYQSNYSKIFILDSSPFKLILNNLNTLGLAIWYMDNGSKKYIHSNKFTKKENIALKDMLFKRFNLIVKVIKNRNYYKLYLNKENKIKLYNIISPFLHKELTYKFNDCINTNNKIYYNTLLDNKFKNYGGNYIKTKRYIGKHTVYDFEVKDNHNFTVGSSKKINSPKIVVHNCQDTTAVTLEIFKLLTSNKKLILGDTHQNIYSYMNTVNGFEKLNNINILNLTKSFRCTNFIANKIEQFGIKYFNKNFKFKGGNTDTLSTDYSISYISKTNATLIKRMYELHKNNIRFKLIRPITEIFSLPIALININKGNPIFDKKYKYLEIEYLNYINKIKPVKPEIHFFTYLQDIIDDISLIQAINILQYFNNQKIDIFDLKKNVENIRPNDKILLSTAHAIKGLETDVVYIEDDLNNSMTKVLTQTNIDKNIQEYQETLNLYYVAISRAKHKIINAEFIE